MSLSPGLRQAAGAGTKRGRAQSAVALFGQNGVRHGETTSTILPIWALVSILACAAAACASGKVLSIRGFTLPAAISGSTCCSTARAIAPLSGTERARSVERYG